MDYETALINPLLWLLTSISFLSLLIEKYFHKYDFIQFLIFSPLRLLEMELC